MPSGVERGERSRRSGGGESPRTVRTPRGYSGGVTDGLVPPTRARNAGEAGNPDAFSGRASPRNRRGPAGVQVVGSNIMSAMRARGIEIVKVAATALVFAGVIGLAGCKSSTEQAKPVATPCTASDREITTGVRTGVEGAKTGLTTGYEGAKTGVMTTAGLVEGGTDGAKTRWKEGKDETKQTARAGAADTKKEAHRCQ
jgi:hypothetical protein